MFWNKKVKDVSREEYIALVQNVSNMKLEIKELNLELALILKKLKFKYKITKRDLKEDDDEKSEDIKTKVLLPEP